MEVSTHAQMTVDFRNDEIDTLRSLVRLAHERLASAPRHQMKGTPLERQAGLAGVDLFRAEQMISKLAVALKLELKAPAAAPDEARPAVIIALIHEGA